MDSFSYNSSSSSNIVIVRSPSLLSGEDATITGVDVVIATVPPAVFSDSCLVDCSPSSSTAVPKSEDMRLLGADLPDCAALHEI